MSMNLCHSKSFVYLVILLNGFLETIILFANGIPSLLKVNTDNLAITGR